MIGKEEEVIAVGAPSLLVEVLQVHRAHTLICELAMGTLRYMVRGRRDDQMQAFIFSGFIPILVEVLAIHQTNTAICDHASVTLWYLVSVDSLKERLVSAGAVPVLVETWYHQYGEARTFSRYALEVIGYNYDGSKSKPRCYFSEELLRRTYFQRVQLKLFQVFLA